MSGEMLRLRKAAARFDVSVDTLRRWADAGLIGRSRIGRVVYVSVAALDRLREPKYARPATTVREYRAPASEEWRDSDLWRGVRVR